MGFAQQCTGNTCVTNSRRQALAQAAPAKQWPYMGLSDQNNEHPKVTIVVAALVITVALFMPSFCTAPYYATP